MSAALPWVCFAGSENVPWALGEDLLWARRATKKFARETSLPRARVVHAAWWPHLLAIGPAALRGKTVLCFADNPPAFYLTQPEFARAAALVDLWIARTREAEAQFRVIGLPACRAPYCVDPTIFTPRTDRAAVRDELGIPTDAFVIGNFHRDSDGRNLARPKGQKGPDIFLEIAIKLYRRLPRTMVLLAGPRRHWLRRGLREAGVPCKFVGREMDADDFGVNVLSRADLNRLYQALDVCVVSSRWEGGPYSVLEALAAGRPLLSTPVGTARDVLPAECLFRHPDEAVDRLVAHADSGVLVASSAGARSLAASDFGVARLAACLEPVYARLPRGGATIGKCLTSALGLLRHRLAPRPQLPRDGNVTQWQCAVSGRTGSALVPETPLDPNAANAREELLDAAAEMAKWQ